MLEESKVRYLVNEIAKDIVPIEDILKTLEISLEDYEALARTRPFKDALSTVTAEWQGATNTPKRVRLKAAAITEELILRLFYVARDDKTEALSAKVKCLEAISKIAGLAVAEPIAAGGGGGNSFNLQINFSNGENVSVELGGDTQGVIEHESSDSVDESPLNINQISSVFASDPLEEL